jgi:nucleotide-binding universal stress UspA family protein
MHVLYATDGSEGALAVAAVLDRLALASADHITIVTAGDAGEGQPGGPALERSRAALHRSPAQIHVEVQQGRAVEVILRRAEELGADLVAVGSRGLNAVARLLLGSVAERVASYAPCPVLVARPLGGELDRALLGIDGSDASLHAAEVLRNFPLPPRCEVRVVTALPHYRPEGTPADRVPGLMAELTALQQQEEREALQRLEEVAASIRESGRRASTEFRRRHAAAGVLEIAEEQRSDLIVVGRQGLSRIERFCMGSVSTNVLRHASASVLIVPEPRPG